MKKDFLISIGGNIGTGKSTVAKLLQEQLAYLNINSTIISVGNAIKEEVSRIYGLPLEVVLDNSQKYVHHSLENMSYEGVKLFHDCLIVSKLIDPRMMKCTLRQLLQIHATEIRRVWFGDDYWELRFKENINKFFNENNYNLNIVLHDDLRFEGEIAIIDEFTNFKFKLNRYPGYSIDISHSSEHDLDTYTGWDYIFDVDGFGISYLQEVFNHIWDIINDNNRLFKYMKGLDTT